MKLKKLLSMGLACVMSVVCISGCTTGGKQEKSSDGKIKISVGAWPEEGTESYDMKMKQIAEFNKKYPDIEIVGDTYAYQVNTFIAKASAGTLPTIFPTWFTEVDKIIEAGYAANITESLEKSGWLSQMNPDIVKYVSGKDGNVYGIPYKVYAQGLYINKSLFKQAGLTDENGNIAIPQTYDDVYKAARTIKEKTGRAGFALPTINNCGGWHSINVAWSYGTEFLSKSKDGKYTSTMDTPDTVAAYEWIKQMRAANVFPDNPNLTPNDIQPLFAAGQAAMFIGEPSSVSVLAQKYGMNPEDIVLASIPEGAKNRASQMGGDLYMIAANATDEQIDAALKWIDFTGYGPSLDDEAVNNLKKSCEVTVNNGGVVLPREAFYLWTDEENINKLLGAREEYVNIPEENLESYYAFEGVTLMPEPEVGCQELYAELDKVIQGIYADSNADIAKLVKDASNNWQVNCLDNLK